MTPQARAVVLALLGILLYPRREARVHSPYDEPPQPVPLPPRLLALNECPRCGDRCELRVRDRARFCRACQRTFYSATPGALLSRWWPAAR
jgi:hypothetical protein